MWDIQRKRIRIWSQGLGKNLECGACLKFVLESIRIPVCSKRQIKRRMIGKK